MSLETILSTNKLVDQSPSAEQIRERAKLVNPNPIKLFYGETFDESGEPIDSMKYYFTVSNLADALKEEGITVDSTILIADTAASRNAGPKNYERTMALGEKRRDFVARVNDTYGMDLGIVKMSDYIDSDEFISERERIIDECKSDPALMRAVEGSVPESKVEIERNKGFLYSFDEITTIIGLDLKVGPPREDLYDKIARSVAASRDSKELMSLFLTPTFPLGLGWSYFFINDGIEDSGITAYKAGSKRLQKNRIIVGNSNPDYIRGLIQSSFISRNPALPNPVLDIGIICEMARKRLETDSSPIMLADEFYSGNISAELLKLKVGHDVEKFILSKFQS